MVDRYRTIVLLGLPGTGKSTQGRVLGELPGFTYFDAGGMFRSLDPASQNGAQVHEYLGRGELVPDALALSIWLARVREKMRQQTADAGEVLIAGGMPRTLAQATHLEDQLAVVHLFQLECDDAHLIERLLARADHEGRTDDANEATIRRRIQLHREQLKPVVDYYSPDRVTRIDAGASILGVLEQLVSAMVKLQRAGVLP